jgi:molybdenum cofactor cytidylyltransferase
MATLRTPVIVLAAGNSGRLGRPKQLLPFREGSLLSSALNAAVKLSPGDVYLVLGANSDRILPALGSISLNLVFNPEWKEGIASSIRNGLLEAVSARPADQAILAVCDQPFLTAAHLHALVKHAETSGKGIVASCYNAIPGTPVLFTSRYFTDLLNLQGDDGARKLFPIFAEDMAEVPFSLGAIDIDTQEDYERLQKHDRRPV